MSQEKVTLDLTGPFIVWTLFFGSLGFVLDSTALFWVAALPWLAMLAFSIGTVIFLALAFVVTYMSGKQIKVTYPNGKVKYIQRRKR